MRINILDNIIRKKFIIILIAVTFCVSTSYCQSVNNAMNGPNKTASNNDITISKAHDKSSDNMMLEIEKLNFELYKVNEELKIAKHNIGLSIKERFLWIYMIGTILVVLGAGSIFSIWIQAKKKCEELITESIYRIDPAYLPVKVQSSISKKSIDILNKLGFKNISTYDFINRDECLSDCVVLDISNEEDVETFRTFLKEENPDTSKVGYVLYTTLIIPDDIVERFPNTTFSNSLSTVGSSIFNVARTLICLRK